MSKWISADALVADLDKGLWGEDWDKALAEAIIRDAPSVEIVRCKDCKHAVFGGCVNSMRYCTEHGCYMDADDFCNHGERSE